MYYTGCVPSAQEAALEYFPRIFKFSSSEFSNSLLSFPSSPRHVLGFLGCFVTIFINTNGPKANMSFPLPSKGSGKGVGGKRWEGRLGARTRIKSKAILIRAECSHIYNLCPAIFLTKFVAQLFCLGDILATLVFNCFWIVTQTDAQGGRLDVTDGLASLWNTRSGNWVGGGSWLILVDHHSKHKL